MAFKIPKTFKGLAAFPKQQKKLQSRLSSLAAKQSQALSSMKFSRRLAMRHGPEMGQAFTKSAQVKLAPALKQAKARRARVKSGRGQVGKGIK